METHLLAKKGSMPSPIYHHQLQMGPGGAQASETPSPLLRQPSEPGLQGGGQGVAEPAVPRGSSSHRRGDPWG